jgi:hypothetical protein
MKTSTVVVLAAVGAGAAWWWWSTQKKAAAGVPTMGVRPAATTTQPGIDWGFVNSLPISLPWTDSNGMRVQPATYVGY